MTCRPRRSGTLIDVIGADLSAVSVFLDFDGTITTADTGVHLLERLTTDDWRRSTTSTPPGPSAAARRSPGSGPCSRPTRTTLRAVAREVPLDPGLGPLVDGLRAAGAEVMVVSDGFGFHVADALAPFGVEVLTNAVDFAPARSCSPMPTGAARAPPCGTCKQAPIKDARRTRPVAVFVGDGVSDRKAALLSPTACSPRWARPVGPRLAERGYGLAEWCELADVAYEPFVSLADVHAALLG